jgi:hypothetical protein
MICGWEIIMEIGFDLLLERRWGRFEGKIEKV